MRGDQVKKILVERGYVLKDVADLLGESPQNFQSMLGAADIKTGVLERIANAINKNLYFFFDKIGQSDTLDDDLKTPGLAPSPDGEGIPLIPLEAIAGYVLGVDNEGVNHRNCEYYIVPEFERIGAEFVIRVSGDSMYPKYSNCDILACKKIKDILFFQWGKPYVLDTSQGVLVKRIFEHENPEYVICTSDNRENYPPFPFPKEDIRSLSIVLGVIRLE